VWGSQHEDAKAALSTVTHDMCCKGGVLALMSPATAPLLQPPEYHCSVLVTQPALTGAG
jgi:hypothetical protein